MRLLSGIWLMRKEGHLATLINKYQELFSCCKILNKKDEPQTSSISVFYHVSSWVMYYSIKLYLKAMSSIIWNIYVEYLCSRMVQHVKLTILYYCLLIVTDFFFIYNLFSFLCSYFQDFFLIKTVVYFKQIAL